MIESWDFLMSGEIRIRLANNAVFTTVYARILGNTFLWFRDRESATDMGRIDIDHDSFYIDDERRVSRRIKDQDLGYKIYINNELFMDIYHEELQLAQQWRMAFGEAVRYLPWDYSREIESGPPFGMLQKKNPGLSWKNRAFVLDRMKDILWYYEHTAPQPRPLGTIYLPNIVSIYPVKGTRRCFLIHTEQRKYELKCESEEERAVWIEELLKCKNHLSSAVSDITNMMDLHEVMPEYYESDYDNPFRSLLMHDSVTIQGYLKKFSPSKLKGWQRRWFYVLDRKLYYQVLKPKRDQNLRSTLQSIKIELITGIDVSEAKELKFEVVTNNRRYIIQAYNPLEYEIWTKGLKSYCEAIKSATDFNFSKSPIITREIIETSPYTIDSRSYLIIEDIVGEHLGAQDKSEVTHFRSVVNIAMDKVKSQHNYKGIKKIDAHQIDFEIPDWFPGSFEIEITFSPFSVSDVFTFIVDSVNNVHDAIFKWYQTIDFSNNEDMEDRQNLDIIADKNYTVRFAGTILYLNDLDIPLHQYQRIRTNVSQRLKNSFIIEFKEDELQGPQVKSDSISILSEVQAHQNVISEIECYDVMHLNRPWELFIDSIEGLEMDHILPLFPNSDFHTSLSRSGFYENFDQFKLPPLWIGAQLFLGGEPITEEYSTNPQTRTFWREWIRSDIPMCSLPRETRVYCTLYGTRHDGVAVSLAWAGWPLFDYRGFYDTKRKSEAMWLSEKNVVISSSINVTSDIMLFTRNMDSDRPVCFPGMVLYITEDDEYETIPLAELNQIFQKSPLEKLKDDEKALLWKYRHYCQKHSPNQLSRLMLAVEWTNPDFVLEIHACLDSWPRIPAESALELLECWYTDTKLRTFAVNCIDTLDDYDLIHFIPQLVQVLKYENYESSSLGLFLLKRALLNRALIGTYLFWQLITELKDPNTWSRYALILEAYIVCSDSQRKELYEQYKLVQQLEVIALDVFKASGDRRKKSTLTEGLQSLVQNLSDDFSLPIESTMRFKALKVDKCKFMDSAAAPLWLEFENADPTGEPYTMIFKTKDDLRQDILTIQMFSIMDKLWKERGLNLGMMLYKVVSCGTNVGMIEVVKNSKTTSKIQKEAGGAAKAFSKKPLFEWICSKNEEGPLREEALSNFIRSCAAYCVATFVIGVGDRHNDNIMVTQAGHLFHIDFGHFLGNIKKFGFYNREQAPFVLTPEFVHVMGGVESEDFASFKKICCKTYLIVRENARLFLSLFHLMLSTGIPELQSVDDIKYLTQAFSLEKSVEEAELHFERLIYQSIEDKSTQINFFVHNLAH